MLTLGFLLMIAGENLRNDARHVCLFNRCQYFCTKLSIFMQNLSELQSACLAYMKPWVWSQHHINWEWWSSTLEVQAGGSGVQGKVDEMGQQRKALSAQWDR